MFRNRSKLSDNIDYYLLHFADKKIRTEKLKRLAQTRKALGLTLILESSSLMESIFSHPGPN